MAATGHFEEGTSGSYENVNVVAACLRGLSSLQRICGHDQRQTIEIKTCPKGTLHGFETTLMHLQQRPLTNVPGRDDNSI